MKQRIQWLYEMLNIQVQVANLNPPKKNSVNSVVSLNFLIVINSLKIEYTHCLSLFVMPEDLNRASRALNPWILASASRLR